MKAHGFLASIILAAVTSVLSGEAVKDREGAVRQDKAAMENDARWIYNDVPRGFAEAKRTGRPLLVTLRCVPCVACMGIDSSVLTQPGLAPLLDQFVCVRLINANTLDLSLFQVDYDLSFSTVIFNGDGTVYGRFGSWQHQKNALDTDTAGFKRALEGALDIHRGYPGNKSSLAGKQGVTLPFRTAIDLPLLAAKYQRELDWDGKVVGSCVHCHQVGDALRAWYREQRKPVPVELIFPWPVPETVGISLAADQPTRLAELAAGSIAARAGLKSGDELLSFGGSRWSRSPTSVGCFMSRRIPPRFRRWCGGEGRKRGRRWNCLRAGAAPRTLGSGPPRGRCAGWRRAAWFSMTCRMTCAGSAGLMRSRWRSTSGPSGSMASTRPRRTRDSRRTM